jgi:hypothetical protein
MKFGGKGLAQVATEDLKLVLARVYDGSLECPITHPRLLRAGLPKLIDDLGHLNGLDARAVQAVIVAVLAERDPEARRRTG